MNQAEVRSLRARASLDVDTLFACSVRVIHGPLTGFTSGHSGPFVGFPLDYDPNLPNWPTWQSVLKVTGEFTYRRVGCGKSG